MHGRRTIPSGFQSRNPGNKEEGERVISVPKDDEVSKNVFEFARVSFPVHWLEVS